MTHEVGFGDSQAAIRVYVKNRPNLIQFHQLDRLVALNKQAIEQINAEAGNGWRKVFNVYAKWLFALRPQYIDFSDIRSWQSLRDDVLLTLGSKTALLFSKPDFTMPALHVIAGRQYAKELAEDDSVGINLIWLDDEFAIDTHKNLVVCPYFDYRQLSNIKIDRLCTLIKDMEAGRCEPL
ncbi:DUF6942 family protein [Pseudoalteromonas pernae]|uniref:DUF6942 family protein n=1 Tax=Pseudoalteromonas pernae TaxID=3118054 RepID=UPI0032426F57